jgi:hypothetical protein
MEDKIMFSATQNKGFSLTFENGNTVSVQWGPMNYCDPEHPEGRDAPLESPKGVCVWKSKNAEVAAWGSDGTWHDFGHDQVEGWLSANKVLEFMSFVANNTLNTKKSEDN